MGDPNLRMLIAQEKDTFFIGNKNDVIIQNLFKVLCAIMNL